ncbi:Anaphase promoting complex subunit 7 [Coemansia sp. 'formosensis']|nr:Anaphase promoting complex subunit 7 [Coemansia sp. 'formosensis']
MSAVQSVILEINELLACDLSESALQLAELECRPRLNDASLSGSERLLLMRALTSSLQAQQQHRAALRTTADFVAAARGHLAAAEVEEAARWMADMRWALGEHDLCGAQLRQIPRAHRTTRDWARMARCAAALGQDADAGEFFGEVLRTQPNAGEALAQAEHSGQQAEEGHEGVAAWARAQALIRRFDYAAAAQELRHLCKRGGIQLAALVAQQATCHAQLGDDRRARALFARAAAMDAGLFAGMGAYAAVLARGGDAAGVYALGRRLLRADSGRAEGWVAMARFLALAGRAQDALAVAWKAQALAPRLSDAWLAEAAAQAAAGAHEDAAAAALRAHALGASAMTYAAAVDALVRAGRLKDAFVYAREAAERMPRLPQALAMVGGVLAHSPESHAKAEALLRAALSADCRCAEAVGALAALLAAQARVDEAVALIEDHLPVIPTADMHARYADVLTLANQLPAAAAAYAAALDLNPDCARARAGFDRVDRLLQPPAAQESGEEEEDEDYE